MVHLGAVDWRSSVSVSSSLRQHHTPASYHRVQVRQFQQLCSWCAVLSYSLRVVLLYLLPVITIVRSEVYSVFGVLLQRRTIFEVYR